MDAEDEDGCNVLSHGTQAAAAINAKQPYAYNLCNTNGAVHTIDRASERHCRNPPTTQGASKVRTGSAVRSLSVCIQKDIE
jgi:hypothetical protein